MEILSASCKQVLTLNNCLHFPNSKLKFEETTNHSFILSFSFSSLHDHLLSIHLGIHQSKWFHSRTTLTLVLFRDTLHLWSRISNVWIVEPAPGFRTGTNYGIPSSTDQHSSHRWMAPAIWDRFFSKVPNSGHL